MRMALITTTVEKTDTADSKPETHKSIVIMELRFRARATVCRFLEQFRLQQFPL
jgi:hypothetical protein